MGLLRGMIFWYGIEKLFQLSIHLSIQQIITVGIIGQASKILFELPTSVFADRWSRKNTLIAANVAMIVCTLIMGTSDNLPQYIIGVLFWSLSDALNSGVYSAFAYDSLGAMGLQRRFRKIYTRMMNAEFLMIGISGLIAGLLGTYFNFRVSYFITVIPMILVVKLLLDMKEPVIHRTTADDLTWLRHISGAFGLMKKAKVRWPIAIFITLIGLQTLWYEYYQLVGIEKAVPNWIFGLLVTVATLGLIIGAEIAHKKAASPKILLVTWLLIAATHTVGLRMGLMPLFLLNLFAIFVGIRLLYVYLEVYIQDNIPSDRRATIISLASTLAYGVFFFLAGGFLVLQKNVGASWAMTLLCLPLITMGLVDILKKIAWAKTETEKT